MYIIIKLSPLEVRTFETKTDLANYLSIHRNTIDNRFSKSESWETEKGIVYKSNKHYKANRGGNTDNIHIKKAKANGQIECKSKQIEYQFRTNAQQK